MYPFVETIKRENGEVLNLPLHENRMLKTIQFLKGKSAIPLLSELLHQNESKGVYKIRILYDDKGIIEITESPYQIRQVHSLQMVEDNEINYSFKSADRSRLQHLFQQKRDCDDVLIVKEKRLTDTSIANIALFDGDKWYTPLHPLLKGTKREELLTKKIICEKDILADDWMLFQKIRLFNAMIGWGELEINCTEVHHSISSK